MHNGEIHNFLNLIQIILKIKIINIPNTKMEINFAFIYQDIKAL